MTSDSGRGGCPEFRSEIETRDLRAVILAFLSLKPRQDQRGRNCEQSLAKTAAVGTHCVFVLPLEGSLRRNKQDKEYRSALGLHKVLSQSFRGSVQYYYHFYDSRSKNLP